MARTVLKQINENGVVTRGLLGVLIQEITSDLAKALNLKDTDGALVSEVKEDSPAVQAGFKRRDIIVNFNGKAIKDYNELPLLVADTKVGQEVKVKILREGKSLMLKPRIGELKRPTPTPKAGDKPKPDAIGLLLEELDEDKAHELEVDLDAGVLVEKVEPNSAAALAGIRKGDIIEEIDRLPVKNIKSYSRALARLKKNGIYSVLIKRHDGSVYMSIKP